MHNYTIIKVSIWAYCLFIQQVSTVDKCKMSIIISPGQNLLTLCIDSGFVALNSQCKNHSLRAPTFTPPDRGGRVVRNTFVFHYRLFIILTVPPNILWGMISITLALAITMQQWRSCCIKVMYTALKALVSYCWTFMSDNAHTPSVGFYNTKGSLLHSKPWPCRKFR